MNLMTVSHCYEERRLTVNQRDGGGSGSAGVGGDKTSHIFGIASVITINSHIVKELGSFRNITWAQKVDGCTHTQTHTNHRSNLLDARSRYFANPVWVFWSY